MNSGANITGGRVIAPPATLFATGASILSSPASLSAVGGSAVPPPVTTPTIASSIFPSIITSAAEDDPSIISCQRSLPSLSNDECLSPVNASARVRRVQSWLGGRLIRGRTLSVASNTSGDAPPRIVDDVYQSSRNNEDGSSDGDTDDEGSVSPELSERSGTDTRPVLSPSGFNCAENAAAAAVVKNCAEAKVASAIQPIGIFWDIENCQVPRRCSAATFVALIRAQFVTEQYWEAEFVCACDASKASSFTLTQLNDAQVDVLHVPATSKNAADDKLKQCLRRFGDQYVAPSTVLLITGDMNFAPDLNFLRLRKKFRVFLVHNRHARPALLSCCDRTVLLDDLVQDVDSDQVDGEDRRCRHLFISDLPPLSPHITPQRLRNELRRLIDNCGGKLIRLNTDDCSAVLAFSTADSAARAKYRLHGAIMCGHQTYVRFYYHPHYHRRQHHQHQHQESRSLEMNESVRQLNRESSDKADRSRKKTLSQSGGMSEQSGSDQPSDQNRPSRSHSGSPLVPFVSYFSPPSRHLSLPSRSSSNGCNAKATSANVFSSVCVGVNVLPSNDNCSIGVKNSLSSQQSAPSVVKNEKLASVGQSVGGVDEERGESGDDRKLMPPPPTPPPLSRDVGTSEQRLPAVGSSVPAPVSCSSQPPFPPPPAAFMAPPVSSLPLPVSVGLLADRDKSDALTASLSSQKEMIRGERVGKDGYEDREGREVREESCSGSAGSNLINKDNTDLHKIDHCGKTPDGEIGNSQITAEQKLDLVQNVTHSSHRTMPAASPASLASDSAGNSGEAVKLVVTNLDPSKSHSQLEQIIIDKVADSTKLLHVSASNMADGSVSAQLVVASHLEAQAVIAQLHRALIGARRVSVAYNNFDRRRPQLAQMRDTVVVSDSPVGRTVCLSQRVRRHLRQSGAFTTPSGGSSCVVGRCPLHSTVTSTHSCDTKSVSASTATAEGHAGMVSGDGTGVDITGGVDTPGWAERDDSTILPCSDISSDRLQAILQRLLHSHSGKLYLASFLECYVAVTGDGNLLCLSLNDDAVCLEQLICNLPLLAIVQQYQHKLIVWRQQPPPTEPINVNPMLQDRVQAFCRKVIDLLKLSYRARLPFSRFIPAYHHHFGQQCRVSDYGFTRLSDLFDALPHLVQIIGSGQRRQITLTYLAQQRRFLADLMRVLKCQQFKQLPLEALPSAFVRVQGSALCVWDYGVTDISELLGKVCGDNVVMYKQNGETFVAIPRREQTPEEIHRTRHFSVEVQELLKRLPYYRVQFNRFIPAYHHHFGRQCRVTDYGFNKLAELFEVISDVVKFSTDEDGEKMVQLTPHALIKVLAQQLEEIFTDNPPLTMTGVSMDRLAALFTHKFGFRLDPTFFGFSSLKQLFGSLRCSLQLLDNGLVNLVDQQKVKCISARVRHVLMSSTTGCMTRDVFLSEFESRFGHSADISVIKDHMKHLVQISEARSSSHQATFRLLPLQLVARDIVSVLRHHGNQPIPLATFPDIYLTTLGLALCPAQFGCHSVLALLEALPETVQMIDRGYKRSVCLVPELEALKCTDDSNLHFTSNSHELSATSKPAPCFWPGPHVSPTDHPVKSHRNNMAQPQCSSSKPGFDPPPVTSLPRPGWLPSLSLSLSSATSLTTGGDAVISVTSVSSTLTAITSSTTTAILSSTTPTTLSHTSTAAKTAPITPLSSTSTTVLPPGGVFPSLPLAKDCPLSSAPEISPTTTVVVTSSGGSCISLGGVSPKSTPGRSRLAINFSPGSSMTHSVN